MLYCHNYLISLVRLDRQRKLLMRTDVKRREIWEWSDHTRPEAPGLAPATIRRLKQGWHAELSQWQGRSLKGTRYIYCWVDGVSCETRLEDARHGILVILGADTQGHKARVGLWEG